MNKTIEAVKNAQKVTAAELFETVNDFDLTVISLMSDLGKTTMSIEVNRHEFNGKEHIFTQSCSVYDSVMYTLSAADVTDVTAKYNQESKCLYAVCDLKDGRKFGFMLLDNERNQSELNDCTELDVYELKEFLDKNEDSCIYACIKDKFGLVMENKKPNCVCVDTSDHSWKLQICNESNTLEVPVADDIVNEFYMKDDEEKSIRTIIVKPFNQPFMEIRMLFRKM